MRWLQLVSRRYGSGELGEHAAQNKIGLPARHERRRKLVGCVLPEVGVFNDLSAPLRTANAEEVL